MKITEKRIKFTYIEIHQKDNFNNTKLINPCMEKLVNELMKNHVYITGSINDSAGTIKMREQ